MITCCDKNKEGLPKNINRPLLWAEGCSCIVFDYGATIDTPGIHWEKFCLEAYREAPFRGDVFCAEYSADEGNQNLPQVTIPLRGEDGRGLFHHAFAFAERFLGSNSIIKPTDDFSTTLLTKLRLQMRFLREEGGVAFPSQKAEEEAVLSIHRRLLHQTRENIEESKTVLRELKSRGFRLGLLTNFYGNIAAVLGEFRLADLFHTVVESATEGIRKPDPRLLALCLQRMGAEAQGTIVVGDHLEKDIKPAIALGCTPVWLNPQPDRPPIDADGNPVNTRIITSLRELL